MQKPTPSRRALLVVVDYSQPKRQSCIVLAVGSMERKVLFAETEWGPMHGLADRRWHHKRGVDVIQVNLFALLPVAPPHVRSQRLFHSPRLSSAF